MLKNKLKYLLSSLLIWKKTVFITTYKVKLNLCDRKQVNVEALGEKII